MTNKCDHPVFVDGAGIMYDELVCENCGYRIYGEQRKETGTKLFLVGRTIREVADGEMFYHDGVYVKGKTCGTSK